MTVGKRVLPRKSVKTQELGEPYKPCKPHSNGAVPALPFFTGITPITFLGGVISRIGCPMELDFYFCLPKSREIGKSRAGKLLEIF